MSEQEKKDERINPWKLKVKLQPCPDCGHQISKLAVLCPGCGRRITFGQTIFSAIFLAGVVLAFFGAIVLALLRIISTAL